MRDVIRRLRAALTPQVLLLLAMAALLLGVTSAYTARNVQNGTELEMRTARVLCAMAGAGDVSVVIMTRETAQFGSSTSVPCGAIAAATGASDPLVRMQLHQALCALLGLPASAVSVVTGGD